MSKSKSSQLSPEQVEAMDNPNVIYVRHTNDGTKYRVRGIFARPDEAKIRLGNIGVDQYHPEWGDVKDVKVVQMHIDKVLPIMTLKDFHTYEGKELPKSEKKNSNWRTYKKGKK